MKKLSFGAPAATPDGFRQWVIQFAKRIELASNEDIQAMLQAYSVTGDFTPTRSIDVATAAFPDLLAFIATLITDVKRGGPNRTE